MYVALDLGQKTVRAVLKRQDDKIVNELKIKKQADSSISTSTPNTPEDCNTDNIQNT